MDYLILFLIPIILIIASYSLGWVAFVVTACLGCGAYVYYFIQGAAGYWHISGFVFYFICVFFILLHLSGIRKRERTLKARCAKFDQQIQLLHESNASLKNNISFQNKDLEKTMQFYTLIKSMADTADWRKMISMIERSLKRFLAALDYGIYLLDTENVLKLAVKQGKWDSTLSKPPSTVKPAFLPARSVIKSSASADERENVLCLPFYQKEQLFGLIFVKTQENQIKDMDMVNQIWGLFSLGIMRARIYWNMEMESLTDGLTKLLRRNYFEERLKDTIKRSSFFNNPFGLMMIDMDHFKQINDTYGHQAGDAVLKKVSQILQSSIYETDLLGRWGGEEFIGLFPRSDPKGLFIKADKIRKEIEGELFYAGLEQIKLSLSIGIAHFPRDGKTMEELVHAADQALYHAKQTGRNRVIDYRQI